MDKNMPHTRYRRVLRYWYPWLTLMLVGLSNCGRAVESPPPTATATLLSGRVTFAGSTTMQPLVEKLADAYHAQNPAVELEIAAGGSVVGITAVQHGQVDVGMVSRQVTPAEQHPGMDVYTIAYDALVNHRASDKRGARVDLTADDG